MFDFNYNPIGKTLAEVAKETKPDHYNGYSVFELVDQKDIKYGKHVASSYSVQAILDKYPEYSDYVVKKTNDFYGTTVLRVMKKRNNKAETEKRDNAIGYFQNLAMSTSPWEREYANIALKAMYKTVELKPVVHGKYRFVCPFCKTDLGIETEDITVYDVDPPKHCKECGQALDWSDVKCRI